MKFSHSILSLSSSIAAGWYLCSSSLLKIQLKFLNLFFLLFMHSSINEIFYISIIKIPKIMATVQIKITTQTVDETVDVVTISIGYKMNFLE